MWRNVSLSGTPILPRTQKVHDSLIANPISRYLLANLGPRGSELLYSWKANVLRVIGKKLRFHVPSNWPPKDGSSLGMSTKEQNVVVMLVPRTVLYLENSKIFLYRFAPLQLLLMKASTSTTVELCGSVGSVK